MKRTFLTDFHIHSTFSDGKLPIPALIDLYGSRGFGAIGITDHIAESGTIIGKAAVALQQVLTRATFPLYMELLRSEAQRAWDQYKMVVIPGFELSKNSVLNSRSAHIVGLGVTEYVDADVDCLELARAVREQGALAIAAHPVFSGKFEKQTYHLWNRRDELANEIDAWEVASGGMMFELVAKTRLPKIANSDLHIPRHLRSWKTQLHCEKNTGAILDAVRKQDVEFVYYNK